MVAVAPRRATAQVGATTDIITGTVTGPDSQPLAGAVVHARTRQTMGLAFQAPSVLSISESDSTVSVTPDSGAVVDFYADGRKVKPTAEGGGDIEIKAHWQGNDFVVERKVSAGGKVTEDYLKSQDGKQLFVIVSLDTGRGRSIEFRRVYDAVAS